MTIDEFYTIKEVAHRLKVCENTVRNFLTRKELSASKVGNQWRISDIDLRTFVASKRQVATPQPSGHSVRKVLPFTGPAHTEENTLGDDSELDYLFA